MCDLVYFFGARERFCHLFFLSHTSIDKPFVEKLAADLRRLGINAWVDKYEIKVGESIFWKVEDGLKESEYFGIVLSPEALNSEWVRAEIASAWDKRMLIKNHLILPILYRNCELPTLLKSIKYADFTEDYDTGFIDLARALGIKNPFVITGDTWRAFVGNKESAWRDFREEEFKKFITELCRFARQFNFSVWVGGTKRPFSVALYASWSEKMGGYRRLCKHEGFAIRMDPKRGYRYTYADRSFSTPALIPLNDFREIIGDTIDEALEFVVSKMKAAIEEYGIPTDDPKYYTERLDKISAKSRPNLIKDIMKQLDWDQGRFSAWD